MKCGQCDKQAMFEIKGYFLCLHCSIKLKESQNNRLKALKNIMNDCDSALYSVLGISDQQVFNKMEIGDINLNHINVSNSTIGMVNTGKIQSESIDLSIDSLMKNGNKEIANALKKFINEVLNDKKTIEDNKKEIIELSSFLAEEVLKPTEYRKKSLIISVLEKISTLVSLSDSLRKIWEYSYSIIKNFL